MAVPAHLIETTFDKIKGWQDEDHLAALSCFRVSARRMRERHYSTKLLGIDGETLADLAKSALAIDLQSKDVAAIARKFFENNFVPHAIKPVEEKDRGFVTAYYEPEIAASKVKTAKFRFPLLKRPDDLVAIDDETRPQEMDPAYFFAKNENGKITYYPDRRQIETGILDDRKLELFWLENRIDIFFIHIQGSARLIMPDGAVKRVSYAGKTGHPFTPIGKILIDRGELDLQNVTMQTIRAWLEQHPDQADQLMWQNRSFIFFQEIDHPDPDLGPVAAAGVPLTPGRSLAIDHRLHTFGTPIWVATRMPIPGQSHPFARLMIAQDTGSAIVGPARGDLFIGTGLEAGQIAGGVRNQADFIALVPSPMRAPNENPVNGAVEDDVLP